MTNAPSTPTASQSAHVLILTSCLYPPDLVRQRLAYRMMDRITELICDDGQASTSYTLLIAGDSIYADASAGLLDPTHPRERFEMAYRRLRTAPAWKQMSLRIHNRLQTIDDHEIIDNWEPSCNPKIDSSHGSDVTMMENAKKHFIMHNQCQLNSEQINSQTMRLWGSRLIHGLNFFLMDTRTEREPRCANTHTSAQMIATDQMTALLEWLRTLHRYDVEHPHQVPAAKFIMSGSMILPRRISTAYACRSKTPTLQSDSWDGYPHTRNMLLAFIAELGIKNVIFLSGDEHIPSKASILLTDPDGNSTTVNSLHGSPLHAPLPFANSTPCSFLENDFYTYTISNRRGCFSVDVDAHFPSVGNGFLRLEIDENDPSRLLLEFVGNQHSMNSELHLCTSLPEAPSYKRIDTP